MEKRKITKPVIDAAVPPTTGELRVWDTDVRGFCLRVYPSGKKVFALKCRWNGRVCWISLDCATPIEAREEARRRKADAKAGRDPRSTRPNQELTFTELVEAYLEDGPPTRPSKRESSWRTDAANLRRHAIPLLDPRGTRRADQISRTDIGRLVRDITSGKTAADIKTKKQGRAIVTGGSAAAERTLNGVRAMYAWALEHGRLQPIENPAKAMRLPARPSSETFLSGQQAADLFDTLSRLEEEREITKHQAAIFKLLFLTGARRSEIVALRWSEVDLERSRLTLPPSRTKAGDKSGERRIALNSVAKQILGELTRDPRSPFVFPASKGKSGHTTADGKIWRTKVRPAAELAGVRLHDLRHSFASFALADGASLAAIGKALGHANARSTERYAHLGDDPLRELSERVAGRIKAPAPT